MENRYVQVPVPEEHVPKVYALLAKLDQGEEAVVEAPAEAQAPDQELVTRMWKESEPRHRRLMEFLAAHPDEWFFTGELADVLEVNTGRRGMAGVFGAFGRRSAHRYGGAIPWQLDWNPDEKREVKYRMNQEVAAWVKAAAAS
jgi:hypothetical protein